MEQNSAAGRTCPECGSGDYVFRGRKKVATPEGQSEVETARMAGQDAGLLRRGRIRDMKTQATALYPFVPSGPHFARSIEFFVALGFEKQWESGGLAGLRFGGAYFLLQDIDVSEWQKNQMIVFAVTDLDVYWAELKEKDLEGAFPGVKLRPPTEFPWGREVHIIDPGGVCWHIRQTGK